MIRALIIGVGTLAVAAFIVFVPVWTHPPIPATQLAPSPASQIQFGRGQMPEPVPQAPPQPLPPAEPGGPPATQTYKNVQVLTDLSAHDFLRLQHAITQWVSPSQGCDFCHAGDDYASDSKPPKQAARVMLRMTRHINADWTSHVRQTGVTCFTCHRGQPVPAETWFPSVPQPDRPVVAKQENWQENADNVRKFFPDAGWDLYLLGDEPISVQSVSALPGQTVAAQIVTKRVYEMMMQMSDGIGVNCGYCHNSRSFLDWRQSTSQRWEGQYGIDMNRELNRNFMIQLRDLIPQNRSLVNDTGWPVIPDREASPQTGNGFILCATCHLARPQPLDGASMLHDYPGLTGPTRTSER